MFGGNRHERRRQAARMRGKRVEDHMMVGSRSAVPDEIKVDICRVVQAIQFTGLDGGTCLFRAGVGYVVLRLLGWSPRLCVGGALYRAGPSTMRDVVAFCGPGNTGQMVHGGFLGHVWLEMDDELIDFSCGDWPSLDRRAELMDAGLGAVQWDALPPTFVWATRHLLKWQPHGNPQLGELWYGPWHGPTPDDFTGTLVEQVGHLATMIAANLTRMNLPARVSAVGNIGTALR
jgi:hypothetical protein